MDYSPCLMEKSLLHLTCCIPSFEAERDRVVKKNNWTLAAFLLVGLLTGTILGKILSPLEGLAFLSQTADLSWQPKGDFEIITYDISIRFELSLLSLLGLIGGFWLHQKL
jgi:hypothetical protein